MADLKGTEAALAFSSGYAANVGTIASLVGDDDVVVSDALNHASIVDGCRLSGADVAVYDHADTDDLAATLDDVAPHARRMLVVTDSVFSMDGDVAPLPAVCDAADAHDALVMVDEAHATGVLGPGGSGEVAAQAVGDRVDVQLATCSKALGGQGGVVCTDDETVDLLVNEARSFVYSTGLSPVDAAVAERAIRLVRGDEGSERRARLFDNVERLADGLRDAGFDVPGVDAQILPVLVGDLDDAVALDAALERRGVFAAAIRPPTVPEGTSRIRVSATAGHTPGQIDEAVVAFVAAGEEVGVI
jgi:8-amino-7-oxononanoate synthase